MINADDKNWVMVDFAEQDARSIKAYLSGRGFVHLRHYDHLLASMGDADLDAVDQKFRDTVLEVVRRNARRAPSTAPEGSRVGVNTVPGVLVRAVVGLLLGAMIYQTFVAGLTQ